MTVANLWGGCAPPRGPDTLGSSGQPTVIPAAFSSPWSYSSVLPHSWCQWRACLLGHLDVWRPSAPPPPLLRTGRGQPRPLAPPSSPIAPLPWPPPSPACVRLLADSPHGPKDALPLTLAGPVAFPRSIPSGAPPFRCSCCRRRNLSSPAGPPLRPPLPPPGPVCPVWPAGAHHPHPRPAVPAAAAGSSSGRMGCWPMQCPPQPRRSCGSRRVLSMPWSPVLCALQSR